MEIDDKYKDIIFESVHYYIRLMNEKALNPVSKSFSVSNRKQRQTLSLNNLKLAQELINSMEENDER